MRYGNLYIIPVLLTLALLSGLCLTGCDRDSFADGTAGGGEATLILDIGVNGTTGSLTRGVVSSGDFNRAAAGELMRTLRVIITDGNHMVEHNLFFDSLDNLDSYTTGKVRVSGNDRKTLFIVANEEAITLEGSVASAGEFLSSIKSGDNLTEEEMKELVLLSDVHKPAWDDDSRRLLPITGIEYIDVYANEGEYTKTIWLHRAAVKYTFIVNNETDMPVRIDSIFLKGASDREFLFPVADGYTLVDKTANNYRPVSYHTPGGTNFREVRKEFGVTVGAGQKDVTLPGNMYFTEGCVLRGVYQEGDKTVEDVYRIGVTVNGVRVPWRNLDWFYPETPGDIRHMTDLPRNTHVVVQLNLKKHGLAVVACVQPFAEKKLSPFFGLARDMDGNIIRKFEDDGTFWSDNPRYGIDGDTRRTIWKDVDGDEIRKKFKDGSFLCTERMYRDWIHDDTEQNHEYTFEKNVAGGNMVLIRKTTPSDRVGDVLDDAHDHDVSDRPLFVKLTKAFRDRQGWTMPVGTHLMVSYDDKGRPSYSRVDLAGDTIIQANGYQFRESNEMAEWMDTYLVKHLVGTDPDGTRHFVQQVKDRTGNVIVEDYRH